MLKKLTPQQEQLMHKVRDEWIQFCLGGDSSINRKIATEGIRWIYGLANLDSPFVIFVGGPMECQYAVWLLKAWLKNKKNWDQVRDQVWDQVGAQVRAQVGDQKKEFFSYSENDLSWTSYWVGFYDFFKRLGIAKHEGFEKYMEYIRSGVFMTIFLKRFAIVCPRPVSVLRDDRNRLHGQESAAIEWANGEKYFFWHGTRVPEKIIINPQEIIRDEIMNEKNSEIARAMAERLGWDEYMKRAETVLVDKWFDPSTKLHYELWDFKKRFEMTPRLLKMESPELIDGTRPYYIEPVDPKLKSCQAARRWQFMKPDCQWPSVDECNENPDLIFETEH